MFNLAHPSLLFRFLKSPRTIITLITGLLLLIVPVTQAANYTYNDTVPIPMADAACGTPRQLNVPDSFIITDLNFGLNATHTFRGDIQLTLQSPAGTSIVIVASVFDSDDNYAVLLDDAATGPLDNNITPEVVPVAPDYFPRRVIPSNPLSAFNGQNANGFWTISACDMAGGGFTGQIDRFSLQFTSVSAVGGTAEYVAVDTAKGYAGWLLVGASSLALVMGVVGGLWVWRQR